MLNNQGHFHAIRVLKLLSMWKDELLDLRILDASDFGKSPKAPIEVKRSVARLEMEHGNEKLTLDDARSRGERIYEEIRNIGSENLEDPSLNKILAFFEESKRVYEEVPNVQKGVEYFRIFLRHYDELETNLINEIKKAKERMNNDE